jgi:uncharacterized protein (TIGR00369 family)
LPPAVSDPEFAERVRASFAAQAYMRLIGARLERVAPGEVDIALDFREDLTQQDGFLHAAVVAGIADSACGYAAYTLMPANSRVLSVEFKTNLLRPATGSRFRAEARVLRAGRTISVVRADVLAFEGSSVDGKVVATMLGTMIRQ